MPYTEEQARAIGLRDVSVALSAGAGCGKTFVLTERFLTHLEPADGEAPEPADLSELIAITFTDRAAREMRDRIRLKCYDRLRAAQGAEARYWMGLLRAIDRARVSTIHAFCSSLLRAHAVEAELDPRFVVAEQSQADTLVAELIDDQLRAGLSSRDELTLGLVADFGLERLRGFIQSLLGAWGEADEEWLAMTPDVQVALWAKFHRQHIVPLLVRQVAESRSAAEVLDILKSAHIEHPKMLERKAVLCDLLPKLASGGRQPPDGEAKPSDDSQGADAPRSPSRSPLRDLEEIREAATVQGAGKKHWDNEETYERYKAAAKKLRDEIDKAKKHLEFDADGALAAAEAGLRLFQLTAAVAESYEARKRELGWLDFGDLMTRARRLLTDPRHAAVRKKLASQTRLLLVDEFQDTDPLQVELVKALCGDGLTGGKLFFVGDFKQSIYRFRGADPRVFRDLQETTPKEGRLPLTLNFRSQPAILNFVNALFRGPFGESYEPLRAHRPQVTKAKSVEFLWAKLEDETLARGAIERLRREEADWIARRLRAMLDDGEELVFDQDAAKHGEPGARKVEPGDIAILFRALSDVRYYEEALQRYGIDYYLVGGHAFYAQQEIFDLLNLLRALASPGDEISLAGALRSPFFGLPDEALFWLGQHPGGLSGGLFARRPPDELDADAQRRVRAAAETLRALRVKKDRMPVARLIHEALARTGYDATLLAEFLGERKLANLHKLIDQARTFDASGVFGLSDFIVQLSRFIAEQPREALAATHPESTNVARLMTIHQSKGLEFPVVVVPDLERMAQGNTDSVALSPELGPLVKPGSDSPTCGLDLYKLACKEEDREERARLFYVACTRAADYLILSGGVGDLEKPTGAWTKLLAERFDLATGELLGGLPAGYARPEIRATLERPPTTFKPLGRGRRASLETLVKKAVDLGRSKKSYVLNATRPAPPDGRARRHYSFSRLTGELRAKPKAWNAEPIEGEEPTPRIDPLGLGSLAHAVLERFGEASAEELTRLANKLAPRHFETPAEAADASAKVAAWAARFLESTRAADLLAAQARHAELEFLLAWPPDAPVEEGIYLQGFIDCLYQDRQGGWQVLDYKTNQVTPKNLAETAAGYEMQLYVYALAAEQVLGEPPRDLVLHFLRTGEEYVFPWNDDARRRLTELVDRAIAEEKAIAASYRPQASSP